MHTIRNIYTIIQVYIYSCKVQGKVVSTWDFEKDISRRQFIGGALALAAASAVPSFIRGAYKPMQSDSFKYGLVVGYRKHFLI